MALSNFRRSRKGYRPRRIKFTKRRWGKRMSKRVTAKSQTHFFKRKSFAATIAGNSSATTQLGGVIYTLNAANGYADFTSLYDKYQIKAVRTDFVYVANANNTSGIINNPVVYTLIDTNDATALGTTNNMLEYGKARIHCLGVNKQVTSVYFRPKMLAAAYATGTGTVACMNVSGSPWITTANPNIDHYGLKYGVDGLGSNNNIDIYHTYYLAFRDQK